MAVMATAVLASVLTLAETRTGPAYATAHCTSCGPHARSALLALRGGELAPSVPMLGNLEELEVALEDAGNALVVVDFYAEWCGPCKKLAPTLESLHQKTPSKKVQFYKVDVDEARELAADRGVKSMPTIQFYRNGKKVQQIVGGDKNALKQEVAKATMPAIVRSLRLGALASTIVTSPQQSAMLLAVLGYLVIPWQRVMQA